MGAKIDGNPSCQYVRNRTGPYIFEDQVKTKSFTSLQKRHIFEVALILNLPSETTLIMLKNYLITAIRNLSRQMSTTVINVSGLTLGITCSLVLFLLVKHVSSFDQYHSKKDRIFRIVSESVGNNQRNYTPGSPVPLPDALRNDFHEIEEVTFVSYRRGTVITVEYPGKDSRKFFEERGVSFGEPNFFRVFDRKILTGDATRGLDNPNKAVISATLAEKYFGSTEVLGREIIHAGTQFTITAVMEDAPANTDVPVNLMLSYITIKKKSEEGGWQSIWSDEQCFVLLPNDFPAANIESRMAAFAQKYLGSEDNSHRTFHLQPLAEMHYDERYSNLSDHSAPKEILVALSVVGLFLILTACINFINLSTAEAIKRSREVGIRKSLGSTRGQLVLQFLGETTLVTLIAMIISVSAAQLMLSFLNAFLNTDIPMEADGTFWLFIATVTIVVSLLSGLYPSLIISNYRPTQALKNLINSQSGSGFNLRRTLVVVQFVISQFFIIGTIVLIQQMNFFGKQDLGFRKDAIIVLPIPEQDQGVSKMRTLRDEVLRVPGVAAASLANTTPSSSVVNGTTCRFEGTDESESIKTQVKAIDGNYLSLYDLVLVAGRAIEDGDTATGFLVNEQFVKEAGFANPQDIVGKKLVMWQQSLPIVGVVKNFHTVSLQQAIEPTVLMNRMYNYRTLSVLLGSSDVQGIIASIKPKWEAAYPEQLFDYKFLDESIRQFYEGEQKMSILLSVFTGIAIFIGCLGLLGLASFMANQKTKEIGVRKVLGASVESIVLLFTKEYIKLILIGFVVASPLAWFVMNKWLENFAYKITIGPVIFVSSFLITLLIAVGTVGFKSIKAATVNPANSLKAE
jgi:putative ABC transport system permease protein